MLPDLFLRFVKDMARLVPAVFAGPFRLVPSFLTYTLTLMIALSAIADRPLLDGLATHSTRRQRLAADKHQGNHHRQCEKNS